MSLFLKHFKMFMGTVSEKPAIGTRAKCCDNLTKPNIVSYHITVWRTVGVGSNFCTGAKH